MLARLMIIIFTLFLGLNLSFYAYAAIETVDNIDSFSELNDEEKPLITVGYQSGMGVVNNFASYNAKGYGYDLLTKLGQYAGIDFEFVEIKGSLINAVQSGIVDIGGIYSQTPQRQKEVLFGSIPVRNVQYSLTTKGENDYYYNDPSLINGKSVATYPDNPGNAALDEYLAKNDISVSYVYGETNNFTNLKTDFYLLPSIIHTTEEFHSVLNLDFKNLYFFSSKENKKLIDFLDEHLMAFFVENASFPTYLAEKYLLLGNEFQNRSLTRQEAAMLQGKTFHVGYIENHAPYQSENIKGEPEGISIAFLNTLAEKYDFKVEYVPYKLQDSWAVHEGMDFLLSAIGEREYISNFYNPTDAYLETDLILVLQQNLVEESEVGHFEYGLPKNAKIGTLSYISFTNFKFFNKFPSAQLIYYNDADKLLKAFEDKQIDALIVTNLGVNSVTYGVTNGRHQYALNLPLELKMQISRAMDDEYLEIFNTIINKEPIETIVSIVVNEVARYAPIFGTKQFIKNNLNYIIAGTIIFMILLIVLYLLVRYRLAISVLAKDDLTELDSFSQFTKIVNEKLQKAKINEYELIFIDVDYFRMINTYYGIDKGTEVILAMADALTDAYKKDDVVLSRRLAEQFLIFKKISAGKSIEEVVKTYIMPRIKSVVGEEYSLNLSVGFYKNRTKNETMNSMLDNARIAHSKAKKIHNTACEEFTERMREEAETMLNVIYRMEHAIQSKEFKVHFQPKIDLNSLKIIGAEALARWIPPIGDPIYPNEFIPVMEIIGFISQLVVYVFEEVCNILQQNKDTVSMPKIAINMSPITLSKAAQIKQLVEILKKYKVSPSLIEIEIAESAISNFEKDLPTIIKILHKIGFSVALDDFGAGNSSLNRLSIIEADVLKLDKAFLDFQENAPRGSMVVKNIISLAKSLDMKVVAEGIEDKNQAVWLKNINCDMAQGYYFAKVLEEDAFMKLIYDNKTYTL